MTHAFDKEYWESHWQQMSAGGTGPDPAPNPYLAQETSGLTPGEALDAGCGEGAEAIWLAAHGWQVTAADISAEVLARASARAAGLGASGERVQWIEADLSSWQPDRQFDLVTTHYAHPAMPQLEFYQRISDWVAPGGSLLIVGHLLGHGHRGDAGQPPAEASATVASITAALETTRWDVVTAGEHTRTLPGGAGGVVELHDVVVRATRRL